jgi:flagellin
MASVINTNMASLYAQKNLSGAQNALSTSVERLSSGLRINRAKDDAAGLGISEKIKSQVTSLNQGLRNANDAISMVQTAEGSLSEVSSILQRMKELSVQARNDSLSTTQRSFISDELVALKNEINAIAERTTFNDLSLLKNALRTQVAVPAAADSTKLVNGASLLDGISVSNLAVKNTNAGTYTITTGTQAAIAGQISEASGKFGGNEVDTITLGGVWAQNDTITATIAIEGGETLEVTYTVSANDLLSNRVASGTTATDGDIYRQNIATGLAAAINVAAQEATGVPLAARASGAVVYLGGASDSVTMTTTAIDSNAGTLTLGTSEIDQSARTVTINIDDAVEGNKITLTVNGKDYSVVVGYDDDPATDTTTLRANQAADDLRALLLADYPGMGAVGDVANLGSTFSFAAGAGLGVADMSLRVNRLEDGAVVQNTLSNVSAASLTTVGTARTVEISNFDVVEGRKATIRVGNPDDYSEYSVIVDASDTATSVAAKLESLLDDNFTGTSAAAGVITIGLANNLGMSNISIEFTEMVEGAQIAASSEVSAKNHAQNDRTITINRMDLSPGNVVSVNVGSKEYAVKVAEGDDENNIAYKLSQLMSVDYPGGVIAPSESSGDVTFNAAVMRRGDSITIAGLTFHASKDVTAQEAAEAFTIPTADLDGSDEVANKYGYFTGKLETTYDPAVLKSALVTDFTGDLAAGDITVRRAVSVSSNVITLAQGLELGLEDISVSVKTITNPGKITITANNDTGIGGTSQSIDVGTIAAGSAKSFDFDNLGVSFTLSNSRTTAVNAASFEAFTPKVNTLAVESAMDGEALFQVGAGTRDNVVLDGFKDIRMTGQNKNVGAEKEVFDKVYETLTAISANTTESLSEANFATLENRIEDAITMVSDFRSYFGGQQNRIEFAIANIQAQSENLTAANSRIVDTDYAAETANLTKTQIMQQAATAMLAQANQMPNVILALLK